MKIRFSTPSAPQLYRIATRLGGAAMARIRSATDFVTARETLAASMLHIPEPLHEAVLGAWRRRVGGDVFGDFHGAAVELKDFAGALWSGGLSFAASDAEIEALARRKVRDVQGYVSDLASTSAEAVRDRLGRFARTSGIAPPEVKNLRGLIVRMTDWKWWRRALRRGLVRELERHSIRLGMVHRRASLYASREAIDRRAQQKRRNARALLTTEAENESGERFTLAELAEHSVSNPAVRRAELMTRIAGFEEFARARGDVGMFYTLTAPSRMHARLAASGQENPKFDGTSPRGAQEYLRRTWAKTRAALARRGVWVYGFRIAEPHHDGTPHWHLLLFMRPDYAAGATQILEEYACETDSQELAAPRAKEARFKAVVIDWTRGSAAGYVAKYVAKNIDGFKVGPDFEAREPVASNRGDGTVVGTEDASNTVRAVDAWASTWGIRQFQQIGGPGVTIWRELRRLRRPQSLPLFDDLIGAADAALWREYVARMGGIEIRRRDRTLQLWRVDYEKDNRYGEPAPAAVEGVEHFCLEQCRTRFHEWRLDYGPRGISRAGVAAAAALAARASRSDVVGDVHISGRDGVQRAGDLSGDRAMASLGGLDGGESLGFFAVPWTGVNNCTRSEISEGCAAWAADYERASEARDYERRKPPA